MAMKTFYVLECFDEKTGESKKLYWAQSGNQIRPPCTGLGINATFDVRKARKLRGDMKEYAETLAKSLADYAPGSVWRAVAYELDDGRA